MLFLVMKKNILLSALALFSVCIMSCEPEKLVERNREVPQAFDCCGEVGELPDEPEDP